MKRALVLLVLLVLFACRRPPPPPMPVEREAGVDAAAAVTPAADPRQLRAVATMKGYNADFYTMRSVDLDGTIRVMAGGLVYEAKDGKLVPIRPIADYAATMPAETVPLVGFESHDEPIEFATKDAKGTLRLFGDGTEWTFDAPHVKDTRVREPMPFRGGLVTLEYERGLAWIGAHKGDGGSAFRLKSPPEKNVRYTDRIVARDGTLLASLDGLPEIAIWKPGAALDQGERLVMAPPAKPKEERTRRCSFAPSFDGNVYACCENLIPFDRPAPTLHRFDGAGFVEAFASTPSRCLPLPSIDREGSLYRFEGKDLERCASNGKCERLDREPSHANAPHYALGFQQVRDEKGYRWFELAVEEQKPDEEPSISTIYARAPDDVWAFAPDAIYHSRGTGPAVEAVGLPTRTDARILAMNEHPPASWTKECDAVFIELGAGATADAGIYADRAKIESIFGKRGPPVEWKVVAGRLHDREVAGVVVWRNQYDWKRDAMNKAIEQFVEAFTRDPMNVPSVYCTLPVLSRVF